jgi:hypothetical protein
MPLDTFIAKIGEEAGERLVESVFAQPPPD